MCFCRLCSSAEENSHSLVRSGVVLRGLRKAEHPAHDPAAVEAPTHITNLSPSPGVLHFHHTLSDQGLPLGSHEDGAKADLFDLHLTGTLWRGGWKMHKRCSTVRCHSKVDKKR